MIKSSVASVYGRGSGQEQGNTWAIYQASKGSCHPFDCGELRPIRHPAKRGRDLRR